jgi:outer membrane protein OmpA-like peptidoglycan-associated protein
VIGPAIRRSVGVAIREFAETLNQILEKSASFRAIRWRIEARLTGKQFSELLLAKSLLYSVEQVFLIHRKSGILLLHVSNHASVLKDADMISGMLTAIQDFFSDSFTEGGQDLETVDAGRFKLWIQHGPKALLVAAVSGTAPVELRSLLRNTLDKVHEVLYAPLDTFKQDDLSVFEPARPYLEACLLGQMKRRRILPWIVFGVLVILLAGYFVQRARTQSRWDHYFTQLKQTPGIVVTGIEKHGSNYIVSGLQDPKALEDPVKLLSEAGLGTNQVVFDWKPYLSLNTKWAALREVEAANLQIEKAVIRFEVGSAKPPLDAVDRIEELAVAMNRVLRENPSTRVIVTGHTDEVGGTDANFQLSRERAQEIADALITQGIPANRIQVIAAGNGQPVRPGDTLWDRASNRSVSFRIGPRPEPRP